MHSGVLHRDAGDLCVPARAEQSRAKVEVLPHLLAGSARRRLTQPPDPAVTQPRAWRVEDCKIPPVVEMFPNIILDVVGASVLCGEEVAGVCIMAESGKCSAYDTGGLASN